MSGSTEAADTLPSARDTAPARAPRPRWQQFIADAVSEISAGLPRSVLVAYVVFTAIGALAFTHYDLHWTVNNSYAYLTGHVRDFYDFNLVAAGEASYFPSVYLLLAVWMAPVKWLLRSDGNPWSYVSPWEIAWAKTLLVLTFWATAYLLARVARELFGDRPERRRVVQAAYLLSPFASFAVVIFGQYDVFNVFFTLLGLLHYLRGDKWRFALFFAIAASFKYFPLVIFIPLLLLQYKKLKDIALLSLTAGTVLVLEALPYISSPVFREKTLFGLAAGKMSDPGQRPLLTLIGVLFALGCFVLWRTTPTPKTLGPLAIHAAFLGYGLMFIAVAWHPQWFMILAPFSALSLGYLRRPGRFIVWESVSFVAFIWYVVDRFPTNVDVTMVAGSVFRSVLGEPTTIMRSIYPSEALPVLAVYMTVFLLSPALFFVLEHVGSSRHPEPDLSPVPDKVWALRAWTTPVAFIGVASVAHWMPMSVAESLDEGAGTYGLRTVASCSVVDSAYGEFHDARSGTQSISTDGSALRAVSVELGTYGRELDGDIVLVLRDATGREVARNATDLGSVLDNSHVYVKVSENELLGPTQDYMLSVETDGVPSGAGFAVWGSSADCTPGALDLGGEEQAGDLNFRLYYAHD